MSKTCFIIQPFDQGEYDKRFDDIISPALQAAGVTAYRVDRDPNVTIPIEQIESGISNSRLCLAEISSDNPNVWFELGFAIALGKEVILVCGSNRERFPFDIQHRRIIAYETESTRDFEALGEKITETAIALLKKQVTLQGFQQLTTVTVSDNIKPHEIAALASVMQNQLAPEETVATFQIVKDMSYAGYNTLATSMALTVLGERGLVVATAEEDRNGDRYWAYAITVEGRAWLLENQKELELRQEQGRSVGVGVRFDDDDIPF